MALLLRLRQAFVRPSSISKCCSVPHFASDSSHLISLSKTLFPTASRQENSRSLSTPCRTQFEGSLASSKYLSVEDAKGIQEIFNKFKKSGFEMIEQLKCTCIRIREKRSVEDSIVIEEMSDNLKKSSLEMIEQLKDMLGFVLVSPDLDIGCKDTKFEGDKCGNEVITPRLPSPHTEYENQLSVEDMEMIEEMSEKLTKYIKVLDKLKAMHGFTSHSCDFYIDRKKKKPEDYIEKAKTAHVCREKSCLSEEMLASGDKLSRLKDYIKMTKTTLMPEKSLLNTFSPAEISMYAADVAMIKDINTWRLHVLNLDEDVEEGAVFAYLGSQICRVTMMDATTAC